MNSNGVIVEAKMAKIKQVNEFEEKQPSLTRNVNLSKDGKWLIIKTIRTDILHVNYLRKILGPGEL